MLTYIASPYTSDNPDTIEFRVSLVEQFTAEAMRKGYVVFSPICHCHLMAKNWKLPKGFDFWRAYDLTMLDHCDQLVLLCLPEWRASQGVKEELNYCREYGKRITSALPPSLEIEEYDRFCVDFWERYNESVD